MQAGSTGMPHVGRTAPTSQMVSVLNRAPMISIRWYPNEYVWWLRQVTAQDAKKDTAKPATSLNKWAASDIIATLRGGMPVRRPL